VVLEEREKFLYYGKGEKDVGDVVGVEHEVRRILTKLARSESHQT
jgi:hypothetical protein